MKTTILEQDISKILGMDSLPEEEKLALLKEIGGVVMESSLLRLTSELTDEQAGALEQYLETEPEAEALIKHLLEHHTNFETIMQEEMAVLEEETIAVLGNVK